MKVLIDTNILLDYPLEREPFAQPAQKIVRACQENKLTGFLAAHSITNMFFYSEEALYRRGALGAPLGSLRAVYN